MSIEEQAGFQRGPENTLHSLWTQQRSAMAVFVPFGLAHLVTGPEASFQTTPIPMPADCQSTHLLVPPRRQRPQDSAQLKPLGVFSLPSSPLQRG